MRIQIFTTGGTIDKVYFDAKSDFEVGDPQIADILNSAGVTFEWDIETLLRKDSLDLDDEDRHAVARAVHNCDCERILVTHGTDTMSETALAIEQRGDLGEKTVVFVGSLAPARFKGTDAEFNIGFAVAAVQILPPGSYIAMNGRIFRAGDVRKNREANRFEGDAMDGLPQKGSDL